MKKVKLLLVEDDELDVISVERSLKKTAANYELHKAYNGKEALQMLDGWAAHEQPDVILLDLNMPKMNGVEFLSIIRKNAAYKHLRVFVMTTSSENDDRQTTEALGISGYIIKPLNYNDNSRRSDSMDAFVQFHLRKIFTEAL